jgi:predicted O-methyltransferase YrrM
MPSDRSLRARLRRFSFGLLTLTGLARRGYFIPNRYARPARATPYHGLDPIFAAAVARYDALLAEIDAQGEALAAIPADGDSLRWNQTWFSRLDAAAAYTVVRHFRPRRIVEIGSGHSTRFLARAVADAGLPTTITAIDPAPRADIAGLGVVHHARVVEDADLALFDDLEPGDILFIDSSHVAMPGGDVDRLILDILPRLAPGVLVHIHDILLPDAYPPEWAWRGYNEQIVVGALLQGGAYAVLFASHYVATRMPQRLAAGVLSRLPLAPGARETSLWLVKR